MSATHILHREDKVTDIRLGTQGWSYPDWVGTFYPPDSKPADYLRFYSQVFDIVELDTTFYSTPRPALVQSWADNTPEGFLFTAKLPQAITHEKHLKDTERELGDFVSAMRLLGPKLGALHIQLPPDFHYEEMPNLQAFLPLLPRDVSFAIEFRHRSWLRDDVLELLRQHNVAWCVIDLYYMPRLPYVTADFIYLRWLGDRRQISQFDRIQIDRTAQMEKWAGVLQELAPKVRRIYGFYNNHYAGHSPASVNQMKSLLGLSPVNPADRWTQQPSLF
jgi:uncharacterized protein YecE (DUF72 family)